MAVTGQENVHFEMDSTPRPNEHLYSHLFERNSTAFPATNQSGLQKCTQRARNNQQSTEDAVTVSRKLLFVIAVFVGLSFLATVGTMILTLTKSENASATSTDIAACPDGNDMLSELRQSLTKIKEEIRALKENLTGGPSGNGILFELNTQLGELKEELRVMNGNKTAVCSGGGANASNADRFNVHSPVYKNCAEVYKSGKNISGVYRIDPDGLGEFQVYCDHNTAGGGWTVFQKRHDGSVDFYNDWNDYKRGFGYMNGEFWLGLDNINRLTANGNNHLRIDLERFNATGFAEYNVFAVENETAKYKLSVGGYSGTAGDSFTIHRYKEFTTKDRDNDLHPVANCAIYCKGAWWYQHCGKSNLNGLYENGAENDKAMVWNDWPYYANRSRPSLTRSEMKIRPKDF